MNKSNYQLPNFHNVIYNKLKSHLTENGIDLDRFNMFCLATRLFTMKRYSTLDTNVSLSVKDEINLETLLKLGFTQSDDNLLIGIMNQETVDIILKIEQLINYFNQYDILKINNKGTPQLELEYNRACNDLESLRSEFKLPARFKYNKFKRRNDPFFKGTIIVSIPNVETDDTTEKSEETPVVR